MNGKTTDWKSPDSQRLYGGLLLGLWGLITYFIWLGSGIEYWYVFDDDGYLVTRFLSAGNLGDFISGIEAKSFFLAGSSGLGVLGGQDNLLVGHVFGFLNDSFPSLIAPLALLTLATGAIALLTILPVGNEKLRETLSLVAGGGALLHPVLYLIQNFPLYSWEQFDFDFWTIVFFLPGLVLASILPLAGAYFILPADYSMKIRAMFASAASGLSPDGSNAGGQPATGAPSVPPIVAPVGYPPAPTPPSAAGGIVPVSNGLRFGAYLLDGILALVTCGIGWLVWSLIVWSKGQTPGKQLLKIHVVDNRTGLPAGFGTMALRELVGKLILGSISCSITTLVSAIIILANPKRQGLWDSIANTTVVVMPVNQ